MSARDAVRALTKLGSGARLRGAGVVVQQQPAPGSPLETSGVATLWLERRPPAPVADAVRP
jgi:hypothetical protein